MAEKISEQIYVITYTRDLMKQAYQRVLIIGIIAIGTIIVGFFGIRTIHALRKFHGHHPPKHGQVATDVSLIRDWMTIPFISRMYDIPPDILFNAVGIESQGNEEKSLLTLNKEYYPENNGFVIEQIKAAVSANIPPTPPQPPTPP